MPRGIGYGELSDGSGNPTPRAMQVARQFFQPPKTLPAQASPTARSRAFGQQGAEKRKQPQVTDRLTTRDSIPLSQTSQSFLGMPDVLSFSQTPVGKAMLNRVLARRSQRGV